MIAPSAAMATMITVQGQREKRRSPQRSDRHLEFFGGAEGYLFAGLDLDRLTGHRIAAHAGSTIYALAEFQARRTSPARPSSSAG